MTPQNDSGKRWRLKGAVRLVGHEMPNFVEMLRLKEMAEEDIYFARRDRELIAELRKKRAACESASPATEGPTNAGRANDEQKGSACK